MSTVRIERVRPEIDLVTLDRPQRLNALSHELVDDLHAALATCADDISCRVVVVTGAGRAFCAGLDLAEMDDLPEADRMGRPQAMMMRQQAITSLVPQLRALRKPVIAAVNGAAAGGGFALALAADVRIASTSARFNAAFVRIGVSGCDIGVSWLLPRLVGASSAFELMLTGRFVDAAEAARIGLVARVVDDSDLLDSALETAEQIRANSPFGVWMTKEVMWSNLEVSSLAAGIDLENRTQIVSLFTQDHHEAVTAFFEKRPAVFSNR